MRRREAGSKWTPNDLKGAHEWQQKFPEHSHETAIAEAVIERLYLENKAIGERDAATKSAATDFLPWDSEEHANGEAESHAGQLADDHGSVKADAIGSDRPTSEKVADEQLPHGTDIRNGETTHATEPAGRARGAEEAKAAESPANKPVGSGWGSKNTLVTQSRADEVRAKLKAKLQNQLNSGFDPELISMGAGLAAFHI